MKKIVSVIAALTLVLAMGLNVCAAPSVNKQPTASGNVAVTGTSASYVNQAKNAAAAAGVNVDGKDAVAYFNANGNGGEVSFDIPGVKDGDSVVAMYKCPVHGWTQLSAKVVNGQVVVNFACCATINGPVVIFANATAVSPKTADAGITTAAVVAMIAVAGLMISKKRFA